MQIHRHGVFHGDANTSTRRVSSDANISTRRVSKRRKYIDAACFKVMQIYRHGMFQSDANTSTRRVSKWQCIEFFAHWVLVLPYITPSMPSSSYKEQHVGRMALKSNKWDGRTSSSSRSSRIIRALGSSFTTAWLTICFALSA